MSGVYDTKETNRFGVLLWLLLLLLGGGLWTFALVAGDAARAWQAFLVNFLFFTSLAAGLVVWTAIVRASRGTWLGWVENLAGLGLAFALPSLLALVALWAGSHSWAPWPGEPAHQGAWLDNTFLFVRDLAALAVFWMTAWWFRRRQPDDRGAAGALLVVYALVFSLLGFDLVMALDPEWVSSLFGGYFFISGLYIAMAALTLMAVFRGPTEDPKLGDRFHDLGKLLLAFGILNTYLLYAQLLPIYYENLPHETRFLVPRMNFAPWNRVSMLLIGMIFIGPLLLLLTVWAKRHRITLGATAGLILAGMWIERWWLVWPTLGRQLQVGFAEIGAALLFPGLLGMSFLVFSRLRAPGPGEGGS